MKSSFVVIVALVAGLVLGSWSGQSDLRRTRKEIAGLKAQLSRRALSGGDLRGITSLLRIPDPIQSRSVASPVTNTNETPVNAALSNAEELVVEPETNSVSRGSMQE